MAATTASSTKRRGPETDPLSPSAWLRRIASWDDAEADRHIREGLPARLASDLQQVMELTDEEAAHLIGRSRSTYARCQNQGRMLQPAEAERAVRFADLLARAALVFGDLGEAATWMLENNYALGDRSPFDLAETDPGARLVRDLLVGMERGHPV